MTRESREKKTLRKLLWELFEEFEWLVHNEDAFYSSVLIGAMNCANSKVRSGGKDWG